jgi:hypothetical protein
MREDLAASPFGRVEPSSAGLCKCGRGPNPAGDRCLQGHPWRGTPGPALVVGSQSAVFWREHEGAVKRITDAVIRDAGYAEDDAPEALRIAATSLARAALIDESAYLRMVESGGPIAASGRTRRAFTVWLQAVDRIATLSRLLGLRRTSRAMGDPIEAVRRAVEEANRR